MVSKQMLKFKNSLYTIFIPTHGGFYGKLETKLALARTARPRCNGLPGWQCRVRPRTGRCHQRQADKLVQLGRNTRRFSSCSRLPGARLLAHRQTDERKRRGPVTPRAPPPNTKLKFQHS